jgi:hypothetical protein
MRPRELSDDCQACASGEDSPSTTTNDALKTSDPVSPGRTVIFHDVVPGLALDRLKKQVEDEQRRLALDRIKKQAEGEQASAFWLAEQTAPVSPWFQKQNEERRQRAEEARRQGAEEERTRAKEERGSSAEDALKRAEGHLKTSDPVSPGPTVIFHDVVPGRALDRFKKQVEDNERRRAEEERRRADEEGRQRAGEERRRAEEERGLRAEEERKRIDLELQFGSLVTRHQDLVDKFLEIAERKVSVLDDYGEENWDAVPPEVHQCLTRLAKREHSIDVSKISPKPQSYRDFERLAGGYNQRCASYLAASLNSAFRTYHEARKNAPQDFRALKDIEFETYVARLLQVAGYRVVGTRATGDQGADLIAKRGGRTIAIQAKGYTGTVGNSAVQEITAAVRFYNADEGWVVTNSIFTAFARSLAHANNIRLIDGNDLKDPLP